MNLDPAAASRCVRDLVALSGLAAAWVDQPAEEIGRGLAEALCRLGGRWVYVRIPRELSDGGPFTCGMVDGRPIHPKALATLERELGPLDRAPRSHGRVAFEDPLGTGASDLIVVPLGIGGDQGVVAVGAAQSDLPVEALRMLVGVAGNQAATALANAELNRERSNLMTHLEHLAADLTKANAVKDELLGLVSHELRTPLTTILGMTEVLRRRLAADVLASGALEDIAAETDRLTRLIENMLVLARVEGDHTGDQKGPVEPVLLQRVLPKQAADARRRHPSREIVLAMDANLPPVLAQPTYVDQIVYNLITNASKYSRPGTPIEVVARADGDSVEIVVRDRGEQMDPAELEQFFEPFFRSSRARHVSGAGLGLTVCRRLVEAQSGRIWAKQRDGGGLEIGFSLPIAEDEAEERLAVPVEAAGTVGPRASSGSRPKTERAEIAG
jgi:signal transduction histidine kinase